MWKGSTSSWVYIKKEKVYFVSLNFHESLIFFLQLRENLIFFLQLQNRSYDLLQFFKTGQHSSLTGLRMRWQWFWRIGGGHTTGFIVRGGRLYFRENWGRQSRLFLFLYKLKKMYFPSTCSVIVFLRYNKK